MGLRPELNNKTSVCSYFSEADAAVFYKKFKKVVMITELTRLINKLPTNGTIKNALGDGPYFSSRVCMFAIAVGTAPSPKPH